MKKPDKNPSAGEKLETPDLVEIFRDAFTLILQLQRARDFGNLDILRQRIRNLLNQIEAKARAAGFSSEDVHLALFACIAFLDETIIASDWSQKEAWLGRPLQLEYFDRFDAGEEFFVRLEKLQQRSHSMSHVLKIYYLCMALGFRGKYQFLEREKIRSLIEETYGELSNTRAKPANPLSPHGIRADEIVDVVTKQVPVWVIAVFALGIGFFFYLIMTFLISGAANDVTQTIKNALQ